MFHASEVLTRHDYLFACYVIITLKNFVFREYQMRVARNMTLGGETIITDDSENTEPQRAALGELKAKKKVPINRANATKQGKMKTKS